MDRRTVVAGLIAALAIACGGPARRAAGDMMMMTGGAMAGMGSELDDAGMHMLADAAAGVGGMLAGAGGALGGSGGVGAPDGGDGDARAQSMAPTFEVFEDDCSGSSVHTVGGVSTTYRFSTFTVEDAENKVMNAVGCGRRDAPFVCPQGVECSGTLPQPLDCSFLAFTFEGDRVRVGCGSESSSLVTGHTRVRLIVTTP